MSGIAQPRLVLASASAARLSMLRATGLAVEAVPSRVDEDAIKQSARAEGAGADEAAVLLADMKARRVAAAHPDAVVIGADQILVCGDQWFDKPATVEDAAAQLRALRGRSHDLVTAVVCYRGPTRLWHAVERPHLTMRPLPDGFIDAYLAAVGAAALQSPGAYLIEGRGVQLFEAIAGDHFAILGLPLLPLLGFLRQHGVL